MKKMQMGAKIGIYHVSRNDRMKMCVSKMLNIQNWSWISKAYMQLLVLWNKDNVCALSFSRVGLCNPRDCSPPSSSAYGIFQARILEWAAFSTPGDLYDPGNELASPRLILYQWATWEAPLTLYLEGKILKNNNNK